MSGRAWFAAGRVLAPAGITRRQLYVLAHECGHIALHSPREAWAKPNHVREHEAETYAHRAFRAYGVEVPEKSAWWGRVYVTQCINEDRARGVPICGMARDFAEGTRSPYDHLPAIDGNPCLSPTVLGLQPASLRPHSHEGETAFMTLNPDELPIACGTCRYRDGSHCNVHLEAHYNAWRGACGHGRSWRPQPRPFLVRLADAIVSRISGQHRARTPEVTVTRLRASKSDVIKLEDKSLKRR